MYFTIIESARKKNHYMICGTQKLFDYIGVCKGSYQVIQARVMGLSYADYLRYLRDFHGAILMDTHKWYPAAYFKNKEDTYKILHLLNTLTREIINARK